MFSDQVPYKDYLSTIQLDLTLKFFSRARVISARRFKSWFLFNSSVVSPWIKTIQIGWSHLRWQRRRRSQVSSCTVPGVSPEPCELGDEKLWWMFGLDLIRSTLKVCHEERLPIVPSSCRCNSRWALCSKGFWGSSDLPAILPLGWQSAQWLYWCWGEPLSTLFGQVVSQLLMVSSVLFVILKNLSSFTSLL